jgi:hypothetical protein
VVPAWTARLASEPSRLRSACTTADGCATLALGIALTSAAAEAAAGQSDHAAATICATPMLLQLRRALVLSWRTKFGGKRRMVAEERAPPDSVEKTTCGVSETVAMAEAEQLGFLWRRGAGAGCSARSVAAASGLSGDPTFPLAFTRDPN